MKTKPLYNIDSEAGVLGVLMLDNSAYYQVSAAVSAEDFYTPAHRVIYCAISEMLNAQKACDLVTLTDHMRAAGTLDSGGGYAYVLALPAGSVSIGNAPAYAKNVRDYAQRRRIIALAESIVERSENCDADELSSVLAEGMAQVLGKSASRSVKLQEALIGAEEGVRAAAAAQASDGVVGAYTGLPGLDRLTGGFVGPRLIVLAATPKSGKSAMLNQFSVCASSNGYPGLIVSLELGQDELAIRAMSHISGENVSRISRGDMRAFTKAMGKTADLGDVPLWIDTETLNLDAICAQIAVHRYRYGIEWAAVDHIGLVKVDQKFNSRNDQIGHVTWTLKQLAKRLKIPIIALSQLNRGSDKEQRRPRPSDLRDSGNIEQDADMVIMLHASPSTANQVVKRVAVGVPANRTGPSAWISYQYEFDGASQTFRETLEQWPT